MMSWKARSRLVAAGAVAAGMIVAGTAAHSENIKMKLHPFGSPKNPETKWIFEPLKADLDPDQRRRTGVDNT